MTLITSLYTKGIVLAGNFTQLKKKLRCLLRTEKKSGLEKTSGDNGFLACSEKRENVHA